MPARQQETEWVTIGQVVAFLGLRGELKVRLLTDIPGRFEQLETVYLGPEHRSYLVESVRPYKGEMVILKFKEVNDANTAESLCQQEILIPIDQLADLPEDSYYRHDILGLTVLTLDQRKLGQIIDIIETGSNDVYMIKGSDGKQVPIPAIKDVVKQVDIIHRTMYIDPIPGLLETATREDEEVETAESDADGQRKDDSSASKKVGQKRE